MKLLQKLFNFPPGRNAVIMRDKQNWEYWLTRREDEFGQRLMVSRYDKYIAIVESSWAPPILQLCDIRILASAYRARGLGTQLLHEVISFAGRKGAEAIAGPVSKPDFEVTPYLLGWYRQHGFRVTMVEHEIWKAHVRLDLKAAGARSIDPYAIETP